jgi:F-type H+-transporting ATPase subunit epsilon
MAGEKLFTLEIVTPTRVEFRGEVKHVKAPGAAGYFGILVNHAPFLAMIGIGETTVQARAETIYFATSDGFAQVLNNKMTLLVHSAEQATDIDGQRAEEAKKRAEKRLAEKSPDTDLDRARAALLRALNRISIASMT